MKGNKIIGKSFSSRVCYPHTLLLVFLLFMSFVSTSFATIHYVSKSGNNTAPYTSWATASHKIQSAIDACARYDTVLIGSGVYYDSVWINKYIYLIGENQETSIIRGDSVSKYWVVDVSDSCAIEGLTIIGSQDSLSTRSIFAIVVNKPFIIKNCTIKNAAFGIQIIGSDFEISNVIITNVEIGVYSTHTWITAAGSMSNSSISTREIFELPWASVATTWVDYGFFHINNLTAYDLRNIGSIGISNNSTLRGGSLINSSVVGYDNYGVKAVANSGNTYTIQNCLIYGRDGYSLGQEGISLWSDSISIYNTIITRYIDGLVAVEPYNGDYNLYYDNSRDYHGSAAYPGENDIHADPMLVNSSSPPTTEFNYRLQYASPAIDAGAPWLLDADGSRSDIGVFGGPGGSSYPYQDLPPLAPKWISSKVENKTVTLTWKKNGESDYLKSYLHRSTVQGYSPDSTTLIAEIEGTGMPNYPVYTDTVPYYATTYYYRLISEDTAGNTGEPGNAMSVTIVSTREGNTEELFDFRLEQNYPNPFNATTMIPFSLKEEGSVTISLYTTTGEKVATLASSHYAKGSYEISADLGHLASGIYLYRIEVHNGNRIPVFRDMRKLVLLK